MVTGLCAISSRCLYITCTFTLYLRCAFLRVRLMTAKRKQDLTRQVKCSQSDPQCLVGRVTFDLDANGPSSSHSDRRGKNEPPWSPDRGKP